ncbi:MAG: histidine kinase [Myxococcota bacterium]
MLATLEGPHRWRYLVLLLLLIGLFNTSVVYITGLDQPAAGPLAAIFVYELTGSLTLLVLFPGLFLWFQQSLPLDGISSGSPWRWLIWLPTHLVVSIVFGISHTILMVSSRQFIFWAMGWPPYLWGDPLARFTAEYQKQILVYAAVAAVFTLVRAADRYRRQQVQEAELKRRLSVARLDQLKSQLNPHFLFNSLNLVACMIHEDPQRAEEVLAELGEFLRMTLRHAERQEVPLREDLEFLKAYLSIIQARFGDRLQVNLHMAAEVQEASVPHLVLQPLVENAVKHATSQSLDGGAIWITAERQHQQLVLIVEDDGPGPKASPQKTKGEGFGLAGTAERLTALYGDAQSIELKARAAGGAKVEIRLPYKLMLAKQIDREAEDQ